MKKKNVKPKPSSLSFEPCGGRAGCKVLVEKGCLHTCPYQQEINNKEVGCNCCSDCTHECMMDI